MELFLVVKWVHIISSTILFGTGIGTAAQMWLAHMRRDIPAIATVTRNVVIVDWIFTGGSAVIQPVSGLLLAYLMGYSFWESWLVVTYGLYIMVAALWFRVVWLQIQVRDIAVAARESGNSLPPLYEQYMKEWFRLGWPAFIGLMVVLGLMVSRPTIW